MALFNKKIKLFVNGRRDIFQKLRSQQSSNDRVVWFHCASLGEFEQGRPIIEDFKSLYPDVKIILTFFSPSGYEIRKDYSIADIVTYLPLDTAKNANKFIEIVKPDLAIFIKYEFWPNMLKALKSKDIKTILVSGIFREEQAFFKWYGSWMRKSLGTFTHFFVQNKSSQKLLENIGFKNTSISGDTRFDRVFSIARQNYSIKIIEHFVDDKPILVAGSTWKKDEELLIEYINSHASDDEKFIIAPHNINQNDINNLKKRLTKKTLIFSDQPDIESKDAQVLIIDSIGLLTKIYSYASVAYVGGGFGAGIHNILEPAAFGIPIVIGPNYKKFNEANELIELTACTIVNNQASLNSELRKLFSAKDLRQRMGRISKEYISNNKGATIKISSYLSGIFIEK